MQRNRKLTITLPTTLWFELIDASAECYQRDEARDCTPESFARECIENTLADRRLTRAEERRLARRSA